MVTLRCFRPCGRFVSLIAVAALGGGCSMRAPYEDCNVVLITIETTRADFLGCYGSALDCTPRLDSLAASGLRIERCYSVAPWTRPSIASIWTGLAPSRHGATREDPDAALPGAATTLAEVLGGAGYRTLACVTNSNLSPDLGFAQGFDTYGYFPSADGPTIGEAALQWMDSVRVADENAPEPGPRPLFVALHYDEPHRAFFQSSFRERVDGRDRIRQVTECQSLTDLERAWAIELYRTRLSEVDEAIGTFIEQTRQRLGERTIYIVLADHGEEWFDHGGLFHGFTLYNELLSVPLIIDLPGQGAMVREGPVRTYDLMPTLCDWLGVSAPPGLDGLSLRRTLAGAGEFPVDVIAESEFCVPMVSIQRGRHKLVWHPETGARSLFDTTEDPSEQRDCSDRFPEVVDELRARLEEYRADATANMSARSSAHRESDAASRAKLEEELRGIGYLGSRRSDASAVPPGVRLSWRDVVENYRFIAPGDSLLHHASTSGRPAAVAPRAIIGSNAGEHCWGEFTFRHAYVLLDGHAWSGIAEVEVDGELARRVDMFAPDPTRKLEVIPVHLDDWGTHLIDVVVTGEKNPRSHSSEVLLDGIALDRSPPPLVFSSAAN